MSRAFYRTYRPKKFLDLSGQDLIRLTLSQAILDDRIASSYLFSGPRGTGKTTTARIFAKAINCLTPQSKREKGDPCEKCQNCLLFDQGKTLDLVEVDAASYTGVDSIRQITENIELLPANLKFRVFIIDEVHMLSKGAFNALLKTLEEPPSHAVFILATTEKHKVPPTIASRCQKFSFRLLQIPEIQAKLKKIAELEKIKIEDESLALISESAEGGMRDAESLFFQIVSLCGREIARKQVEEILGISGKEKELEILEKIKEGDFAKTLKIIEEIHNSGSDMFLLSHNLLLHLRRILFLKSDPEAKKFLKNEISQSQIEKLLEISEGISLRQLIGLMGKIMTAQPLIKSSSLPLLPLSIAFSEWILENCEQKASPSIVSLKTERKEEEKKNEIKKEVKSETIPLKIETEKKNKKVKLKKKNTEKKETILPKDEQTESLATELPESQTRFDISDVTSNWNEIILKVRDQKPALFSLLQVCSPLRIEGDTLVVATPYKFHKDKLNDNENRQVFCLELSRITGLSKVCVVEDKSIEIKKPDKKDLISQVQSLL